MTDRTPGPWCVFNGYPGQPEIWQVGANTTYERPIAILSQLSDHPLESHPTTDANAEFIVRACNAHDDLLAALQELSYWSERVNGVHHCGLTVLPSTWSELYAATNAARAAIAKATGKEAP